VSRNSGVELGKRWWDWGGACVYAWAG
jgi:hypothetical protein